MSLTMTLNAVLAPNFCCYTFQGLISQKNVMLLTSVMIQYWLFPLTKYFNLQDLTKCVYFKKYRENNKLTY